MTKTVKSIILILICLTGFTGCLSAPQGVVTYGGPSRQVVERRGSNLLVTNYRVDPRTGNVVRTQFTTNAN